MEKNTKLHTFIMGVFILCGIYALYTEPFNGQSIVLIGTLIVGIVAIVIINIQERLKMAEEKKESKGSNLIQLKVSDKAKEQLEKKADEVGMPITTYLYSLIIKDLKEK